MREKLIVALLSVCCTLLAVNLLTLWRTPAPAVYGQVGGAGAEVGNVVLATVGTQTDPMLFVYDKTTSTVVAYSARSNGLRVKGVRYIGRDFNFFEQPNHFPVNKAPKTRKPLSGDGE